LGLGYLIYVTWRLVLQPKKELVNRAKRDPNTGRRLNIPHASIWLPNGRAKQIETLVEQIQQLNRNHGKVFLAPLEVTYFPLLNKVSPVYDTFPVYPATEEEQLQMIEQLVHGKVEIVVIRNVMLDGRKELQFKYTYPQVWHFLLEKYTLAKSSTTHKNYSLFSKI
ncbi:MAG: hypothetical protein AB8G22_19730, partial [Saprospiraceae bacterium]